MFIKRVISFSNLTLLVALSLSSIAAYYSIIGLTAIFAGAVIPIIIMGSVLEVGKITTTVWLRKYWKHCGIVLKLYLVPAVVLLAFLTSMGIFGFLSKAHTEQGLVSGDSQAKLAIYDEKIKTQRDNIEVARKALQQMDAQVDARLSRGDSEQSAERAVQIRRQQANERTKLQKEIAEAQKEITKLNEERAPIAAENRKVEAEVGPIKYIAALIYGDNPDANLLEAAVRWVIILIVIVFDPLAIALVLAANASKEWDKLVEDDIAAMSISPDAWIADVGEKPTEEEIKEYEKDDGPLTDNQIAQVKESVTNFIDLGEHPKDHDDKAVEESILEETLPKPDVVETKLEPLPTVDKYAYLKKPFGHFKNLKPMVATPDPVPNNPQEHIETINDENFDDNVAKKLHYVQLLNSPTEPEPVVEEQKEKIEEPIENKEIATEGVTKENPLKDLNDGYVLYEGKHFSKQALKEIKPEIFLQADNVGQIKTNFGTQFPTMANKGDIFVRVDVLPNRVYKFSENRWIEINKNNTDSYLHDQEYIKYLVSKISIGEYDLDLLTETEKTQIEDYLKNQS